MSVTNRALFVIERNLHRDLTLDHIAKYAGPNEEPRRPVVSGERPGLWYSVRGDPPLGHLIDSAGMVILRLKSFAS
jgi:hypothetical protein